MQQCALQVTDYEDLEYNRHNSYHALSSAPLQWPNMWQWLPLARRNALKLFPQSCYQNLREDHRVFGQNLVVVSDPASIQHICGSAFKKYGLSNLHLRMLKPALGNGLIVAEGKEWSLQRRLALSLTRQTDKAEYGRLTVERIDETIDGWLGNPRTAVDPTRDLMLLALDLIALHIFDYIHKVGGQDVLEAISSHRETIENADIYDALSIKPDMASSKMRKAHKIAHSLDEKIDRAIKSVSKDQQPDLGNVPLRDFVVSMLAGFESVTIGTLWTLGLLTQNRNILEDIQGQTSVISPPLIKKKTEVFETLLGRSISEALRLYPPLPLIYRTAKSDDITPSGVIAKGDLVCLSPWIVQRHHKLWDQPDRFMPDRFLNKSAKDIPAFMPFGLGARQCVGMHMGNNMIAAIVGRIIERCHIDLEGDVLPAPRIGVSLRPESPMMLRFTPASVN